MGILAPIGRLLFSAIFIFSGLNHLMQYSSMVGYARSIGLPRPELAIIGAGIAMLVGGLCVLLGLFARLGALLLAIFLVASAFMVHHFWTFTNPMEAQQQMVNFMKNISMTGGALLIMYFGPGPFSLTRRRETGLGGSLTGGGPLRQRHA
jgi:putative oxidoreductase